MNARIVPGLCLVLPCVLSNWVLAEAPPSTPVEVIEKWEMRLDTPNLPKDSPQFVTHFEIDHDTYFLTLFNFRDDPELIPGGIQLQLWDQGYLVDSVDITVDSLDVVGDTVTWSQRYRIQQGTIEMSIFGVNGQAWGQLNPQEAIVRNPADMSSFATYNPASSVAESHVMYGGNAVLWFGMTEYEVRDDKKKIQGDTTARTVHARQ